jgi:hypothetical protein
MRNITVGDNDTVICLKNNGLSLYLPSEELKEGNTKLSEQSLVAVHLIMMLEDKEDPILFNLIKFKIKQMEKSGFGFAIQDNQVAIVKTDVIQPVDSDIEDKQENLNLH